MGRQILFPIKCKLCKKEFVYCVKAGSDFRCYDCKSGYTLEAVQQEIEEMSEEEYQSFMDDIKEHKDGLKKL